MPVMVCCEVAILFILQLYRISVLNSAHLCLIRRLMIIKHAVRPHKVKCLFLVQQFDQATRLFIFIFNLNCVKIQTKLLVFFVHFVIIHKISLFSVKLDNVLYIIHNII